MVGCARKLGRRRALYVHNFFWRGDNFNYTAIGRLKQVAAAQQ
jgi:hypothetical protein